MVSGETGEDIMAKTVRDGRPLVWVAMALAAALVLSVALAPVRALAADTVTIPDPDEKGSITLKLEDAKGKAVSGGKLTIYQVADAQSDEDGYHFAYVDDFASQTTELTQANLKNPKSSFIASLEKVASKLKGNTRSIDKDGNISFTDLYTGVYLVVQTEAADGYKAISSFLVSIPYDYQGTLTYDLTPKMVKSKVGTVKAVTGKTTPSHTKKSSGYTPSSTPFTSTTTGTKLPQTGQLWWPVWILAAAGSLLVVVGLVAKSRSEKKSDGARA